MICQRCACGENAEMMNAMYSMYLLGTPLWHIGLCFNMSGKSVKILLKHNGTKNTDKMWDRRLKQIEADRDAILSERLNARTLKTHGCDYETAVRLNFGEPPSRHGSMAGKYTAQKTHAARRGIGWEFTFPEWVEAWGKKFRLRGSRIGQLVMCRKGDSGPYRADNVYIATCTQNIIDGHDIRRLAKASHAS